MNSNRNYFRNTVDFKAKHIVFQPWLLGYSSTLYHTRSANGVGVERPAVQPSTPTGVHISRYGDSGLPFFYDTKEVAR